MTDRLEEIKRRSDDPEVAVTVFDIDWLIDEVDALRAVEKAVHDLCEWWGEDHTTHSVDEGEDTCDDCLEDWPCPANRLRALASYREATR